MPMTRDTSSFDTYDVSFQRYDGSVYSTQTPLGRAREQLGYRSGRLPDAIRNDLDGKRSNTWANSLRVIQGLEYEYNTRAHRQASVVNPRDYEVNRARLHVWNWATSAYNNASETWYHDGGTSGLRVETFLPSGGPLWVTETEAAIRASKLMRSSVPTAPAIDLVRSLAELRDLPRSARLANYLPYTGRDYGNSYLNFVFGLAPIGKDLATLANVVLRSTAIMQNFIAHERQRLRRSRTEEYGSLSFNAEFIHSSNNQTTTAVRDSGGRLWANVTTFVPPSGRRGTGTRGSAFRTFVSVQATTTIKSFATFEYFIPRPTGFVGRLEMYRRKAEQVLGNGLSPGAVYNLTPWSWLADWMVDVGGLIRYQQTVSDNGVVASRSGWVSETRSTVMATMSPRTELNFDSISGSAFIECTASRQRRRPGGPYQILQPWTLSETQAAIVAALGISRYSPY